MEGNKVKALAKEIMDEHSWWVLDEESGFRVCTGKDCGATLSETAIPTPEERLSHQLDKLAEAGFTFIEPEKDRFGGYEGETIESPGMVRWYNDSHYFLKRIGNMWQGVSKPKTFVLGLENRIADGAYFFSTSIEFDNDEAPDLMDRIADFNGIPKYTDLLNTREALEHVIDRLNGPDYADGIFHGAILRELNMALDGEKRDNG